MLDMDVEIYLDKPKDFSTFVILIVLIWIHLLNYYFTEICGVAFHNSGHIAAAVVLYIKIWTNYS